MTALHDVVPGPVAERRGRADFNARAALVVFVAVAAGALVVERVLGRFRWFFRDEWEFLANRDLGDVSDLLRPHNEHWSTAPIVVFRGLWWLVGLRSYLPYQLTILVLHLTAAALLRVVMRRAGAGPWASTAAASLFALFGAGLANIVWAFQIGFVGSLVLGLIHLLLADHDGQFDRRDWFGLAAGLLGLMCSGVGVTMALAVGVAVLIRRGWRVAAVHTVPLAVVYVAWWLAFARSAYRRSVASIGEVLRFVWTGLRETFEAIGQFPVVGIALAVMLAVGLFLAWRGLDRITRRRRAAAPAALIVAAVAFLLATAVGRAADFGPEAAGSSRYVGIVAALLLPALAVAADAVARRWRLLAPVAIALLVVGIPGNIEAFVEHR
ncbi:MAG: hypothetical protein ACRDWD_15055, partial [Acidimicrobiia bacterium]